MATRGLIGSSASKKMCGASEDIISEMPKNVIDMIIDALPIRDAVMTSVLSAKWRYRWVTTSELVFTTLFFERLSDKYKNELQVKDIINKIFLLHTGHIRKFVLITPNDLSLKDDINHWLHFLLKNGVREFTYYFPGDDLHQLGMHLYSCHELTHLEIANCILNPPNTFEGFPNLKTLELFMVSINEKFGEAISACPRLEKVCMKSCYGIQNLVVRASNLKFFRVMATGLKTIWLRDTKNLASFSMYLGYATAPERLEKLHLDDNILEFAGASCLFGVPKRLPTSLDNLKKIVLQQIDFSNATQMACTICMIRSSPKLSELEIWGLYPGSGSANEPDNDVEDYGDDDGSFDQLRIVKLVLLRDLKAEMAFVKFLLARCPLLEIMSIKAANSIDKTKSLSMCKKLMRFVRVSPKASLIYLDPDSPQFVHEGNL